MEERELIFLCHGVAKAGTDGNDLERPLKTVSKRQAQKLGSWLQEHNHVPDATIASPAERAIVSAEKALKAGGWTAQNIAVETHLYQGSVNEHLETLRDHQVPVLLCVGHADTLSDLLRYLAPNAPTLVPGSLARLTCGHKLAGGSAKLCKVVLADTLPDGFPYPAPGSPERRDRPAYYYRQSGALPFRIRDGKKEVLLITSSSGRKWGIPKGICEPGLSPQASAAQEAFEEAGIDGRVLDDCIGQYEQPKWGAICSISVYPMEVTDTLPEACREESHRRREWLRVIEAAKRVTAPGLAAIISEFQSP